MDPSQGVISKTISTGELGTHDAAEQAPGASIPIFAVLGLIDPQLDVKVTKTSLALSATALLDEMAEFLKLNTKVEGRNGSRGGSTLLISATIWGLIVIMFSWNWVIVSVVGIVWP